MPVGIVALSFAKRAEEPNPVNKKLADIVDELDNRIQEMGDQTVIVSQWEVELAMTAMPVLIVSQEDATNVSRNGKPYLDSQDVLNKAFEEFRAAGVTDVAVVANQFLHQQVVEKMVTEAGFTVFKYKSKNVGFDNSRLNLQWWCKGPIRFVTYLGIQVLGKLTKQNFHGIGEKSHPH